jgi:hypothetical protein
MTLLVSLALALWALAMLALARALRTTPPLRSDRSERVAVLSVPSE